MFILASVASLKEAIRFVYLLCILFQESACYKIEWLENKQGLLFSSLFSLLCDPG